MKTEVQVTYCPPSKRNKPKSVIKCQSPINYDRIKGTMTERKERIEQEIQAAVDEQLLSLR